MPKIQEKYPHINPKYTGYKIKKLMDDNEYDVKDIQEYLHLACPQSVYRWISGKKVPTLDQVYALSTLFKVHMEEMIAPKADCMDWVIYCNCNAAQQRLLAYFQGLCRKTA